MCNISLSSPQVGCCIDTFLSDDEEYESGDLDTTSSEFSWEGRTNSADAWVSPGRDELSERLIFAYIEPTLPVAEVTTFICAALRSVVPLHSVDLLPSSRGDMRLRCDSRQERDSLRALSPIVHEGWSSSLTGQRRLQIGSIESLFGLLPLLLWLISQMRTGTRARLRNALLVYVKWRKQTKHASLEMISRHCSCF